MSTEKKHPKITAAGYALSQSIGALSAMVDVQPDATAYRPEPRKPLRGHDTVDARLDALRQLRYVQATVEVEQGNTVRRLRSEGATWQMIGDALMMTRSGAQQKFGE